MRTEEDLILVSVTLTQKLTIDREQLEMNPTFRSIWENFVATREDSFHDAVKAYVARYVLTNSFPKEMPATTGPGIAQLERIEVRDDSNSSNDQDGKE